MTVFCKLGEGIIGMPARGATGVKTGLLLVLAMAGVRTGVEVSVGAGEPVFDIERVGEAVLDALKIGEVSLEEATDGEFVFEKVVLGEGALDWRGDGMGLMWEATAKGIGPAVVENPAIDVGGGGLVKAIGELVKASGLLWVQ